MTSKKAHKWFIGTLFLFGILLLPLVFAYEFDNAKTYNPVDRSITIKNTFLGIPLDTVAKVTPTTPHVNYVVRGQDRLVAEFDIDSYVVYTEKVWDGMKFYDLNSQIHKEINRDFHIKYATYREVEIPTTALECTDTAEINKTSGRPIQECKEIAGKPIIINETTWNTLDYNADLPKGKIHVGIFADVMPGDYVEFIPTWFGVSMPEYAVWDETLSTDLVAYWDMNSTTDIYQGKYNLTADRGTPVFNASSCLIGNCSQLSSSGNVPRIEGNNSINFGSASNKTLSFWFRITALDNNRWILDRDTGASHNGYLQEYTGNFYWGDAQWVGATTQSPAIATGGWYHVVYVRNDTKGTIYVNGNRIAAGTPTFTDNNNYGLILGDNFDSTHQMNGQFDEIALWSRALTSAEVTQLYNGGAGITYIASGGATPIVSYINVILNAPANDTYTTQSTVTYNSTGYFAAGNFTNATLYLWKLPGLTSQTNITILTGYPNKSTNNLSLTFGEDGSYKWNVQYCGINVSDAHFCNWSLTENRTIYLDTTFPKIKIDQPSDFNLILSNINTSLNYSINEVNKDSCWYYYNATGSTTNNFESNTLEGWRSQDSAPDKAVATLCTAGTTCFPTGTYAINLSTTNSGITKNFTNLKNITISVKTRSSASSYNVSLKVNGVFYNSTPANFNSTLGWNFDTPIENATVVIYSTPCSSLCSYLDWFTIDNIVTYANTPTYVNCSSNTTLKVNNQNWLLFYANDTLGHVNYTRHYWDLTTYLHNPVYNIAAYETSNETIKINVTTDGSLPILAKLVYNGTNYSTIKVGNNYEAEFTAYALAPMVAASQNVSFYWIIQVGSSYYTSPQLNQTILENIPLVSGENCSEGFSPALNFTFFWERNLTNINVTIVNYYFTYGLAGNVSANSLNQSLTNVGSFAICINNSQPYYYIGYGELQYTVDGASDRRYYVFSNYRVTNSTINIPIYSLDTALSTSFLMTAETTALDPYINYYIGLLRWYPEINSYKVVEMGKTDNKGQTILRVKTEDVDYRFALYQPNGEIVKLFEPVRLICQTNPCIYTLFADANELNLQDWFNIEKSFTYNETTHLFTFYWNDPSQAEQTMNLTVWLDGATTSSVACSSVSSGYTGVLICDVTGYTGTLRGEVTRTASPGVTIAQIIVKVGETFIGAGGGTIGLFIGAMILIVFALVGTISPIIVVILGIIALIPLVLMGNISWVVFAGIGVVGGVIIHFMTKR